MEVVGGGNGAAIGAADMYRGVGAVAVVYLIYSALLAPNTILVRPHRIFWRLVHGVAVLYLLFLVFLLAQSQAGARHFLKVFDSKLGEPLPERSYGTDCRVFTPENPDNKFKNVYDTLFDEFVLAHALGWFFKAIIFRSHGLLWVLSVGFEVMETLWRHLLPNFSECWWDSIIMDILTCNWLGLMAGMKAVEYFKGLTYDWACRRKVVDSPSLLNPAQWFATPKRFLQVMALIGLALAVELNCFFLKQALWIPPPHVLNILRLIIWFLISTPAAREYYDWMQNGYPISRLGSFCWLAFSLCFVEGVVAFKFGKGTYPGSMPLWVKCTWALVSVAIFAEWQVLRKRQAQEGDYQVLQSS